ncbi:hypothetical protein Tco_1353692 [Tanacetum coccineum]
MLASMNPNLQKNLEDYNAYYMLQELKTMFQHQANEKCSKQLKHSMFVNKRNGELGLSLILNSLSKNYEQFVHNYNMHSMGKTIVELHAKLKLSEKGIPKKAATPVVLTIR